MLFPCFPKASCLIDALHGWVIQPMMRSGSAVFTTLWTVLRSVAEQLLNQAVVMVKVLRSSLFGDASVQREGLRMLAHFIWSREGVRRVAQEALGFEP